MIFTLSVLSIYCEDIGENIFTQQTDFYIVSKTKSLNDIKDENFEKYKKFLEKYDMYKGTSLTKVIENNEFAFAFSGKDENLKFAVISKIKLSDYITSGFYENINFEEENIQMASTYYITGAQEYIYSYIDGYLYASNNISLFFEIMNNLAYSKENLGTEHSFFVTMPKTDDFEYKYYMKKDGNIKGSKYKAFSVENKRNEISIYYYLPEFNDVDASKTYNFSDFIPETLYSIYYGSSLRIVQEQIQNEFKFIDSNEIEQIKITDQFQGMVANVVDNNKNQYLVINSDANKEDILNKIKKIYESLLLYNDTIELANEEDLYWINLPLLEKKIYMGIIRENYIVITDDLEVYNNVKSGKYYNYNYSRLSSDEYYFENFMTEEKESFEFEEYLVIEKRFK